MSYTSTSASPCCTASTELLPACHATAAPLFASVTTYLYSATDPEGDRSRVRAWAQVLGDTGCGGNGRCSGLALAVKEGLACGFERHLQWLRARGGIAPVGRSTVTCQLSPSDQDSSGALARFQAPANSCSWGSKLNVLLLVGPYIGVPIYLYASHARRGHLGNQKCNGLLTITTQTPSTTDEQTGKAPKNPASKLVPVITILCHL